MVLFSREQRLEEPPIAQMLCVLALTDEALQIMRVGSLIVTVEPFNHMLRARTRFS
jgi:hypothetical protein